MNHLHLFISAVSSEFSEHRSRLRQKLERPNVSVKIQEDFIPSGTVTLDKLDDYIIQCEAVIHVIGNDKGSMANMPSIQFIKERYPNIVEKFPKLSDIIEGKREASYTQWEAYLALFHNKKIIIAQPKELETITNSGNARPQEEHIQLLRAYGRYIEVNFENVGDFVTEVLRGPLVDLLSQVKQTNKPTSLPYQTLDSLFKGRDGILEELGNLFKSSSANKNTTRITGQAIYGLGGIGKTRVAIEYAWRYADSYNALLFVVAETIEDLNRNIAALCNHDVLDLKEKEAPAEAEKVAAVLKWLQNHPGWLLIIDNCDTEPVQKYVENLLPKLHGGHVIITSRLTNWDMEMNSIQLEVLTPEDARDFLLERTNKHRKTEPDDDIVAREIAVDLGGLALAMEQAGAHIQHRHFSLREYKKIWEVNHEKTIGWYKEGRMKYPKSVASTWQTSFDQLSIDAKKLLNLLAWFSPEPIPEQVFEVIKDDDTKEAFFESLSELEAYSLISRDRTQAYFSIHRLVQDVTRQNQEEEKQKKYASSALLFVNRAFIGNPTDVMNWHVLLPLLPHALTTIETADRNSDPNLTTLMNQAGLLLKTMSRYNEAEPLYRKALEIDKENLGPNHSSIAVQQNNLASLLRETNRLDEAEPLIRDALRIDEQNLGKNHPDVAIRLNNLSLLLQSKNKLIEAESLMRRALQIDEQVHGKDHPLVARRLNNLAQILQNTNRLEEAEELMRRALKISEQYSGKNHPNTAIRLSNLAMLLADTKRIDEAIPLVKRSLEINELAYGKNHPIVATDLGNLALLWINKDKLDDAEPLLRQALNIYIQCLGENHPKVATLFSNLAQLLKKTNKLQESETLLRKALKILEVSLEENHTDVSTLLCNLAVHLADTNRSLEAEPLIKKSLLILNLFKKETGFEHPNFKAVIHNYKSILVINKKTEAEAVRLIDEILKTNDTH